MRSISAFVAFVVLAWVPLPADSREISIERSGWIRLESEHFVVRSELPPIQSTRVSTALEGFRAAMVQILAAERRRLPATHVYLFGSRRSLEPYALSARGGHATVFAGFSASTPIADFVAIDGGDLEDVQRLAYHESVHLLLHHLAGPLPRWAHEGLAEYYSTLRVTDGGAGAGTPPTAHLVRLLEEKWIPLERLLASDAEGLRRSGEHETAMFYAQSWLVVHYLMHESSLSTAELLELARSGVVRPKDGQTIDLRDAKGLEPLLRTHLERGVGAVRRIPIGSRGRPTMEPIRSIPPASLLNRMGELLLFVHHDLEGASAHFRRALELNERAFGAWSGLGYLELIRGRRDRGWQLFDQVHELRPAESKPYLMHGLGCLERFENARVLLFPSDGVPDPWVACARERLSEATRLDPRSSEALAALGATYLYTADDLAPGIRSLERALELSPGRIDFAANLAALYAGHGRADSSRALLDRVEESGHEALIAEAQRLTILGRRRVIHRLVEQGRVAEAVADLETLVEQTQDPELRAALDAERRDLIESRTDGGAATSPGSRGLPED